MDETTISFGQWIKKQRRARDLTQGALAHCAGCSISAIRKIENDMRRPSRQVAELPAGCLGIPPEEWETFLKVARQDRQADYLTHIEISASLPQPQIHLPLPSTPLIDRLNWNKSMA